MDDRRPALYSIVDQLSRPRRDFLCTAADLQRFSLDSRNEGPAALVFLLVVCTDASSHRLVRRPSQPALALRRSLRRLVAGAGPYGPRRKPCSPDRLPYSPRCGRIHLPSRRNKDRQRTLHSAGTRPPLRSLRLWHANRTSPRRGLSTVAL